MNHDPQAARRIDQACDRFEADWLAGRRPAIEAYLNAAPESDRPALLAELVALDLEYRRGEAPTADEYHRRFPDQADPIRAAFRRPLPSTRTEPGAATTAPGADGAVRGPPSVRGYEIIDELGRGGMGVVYKARDVRLNRVVALKMVLAAGHAGERELARFRQEAEAIARLQHPNVVQVYEVGDDDGRPFLALEYVPGGTLAKRLAGTPQPPADAARLAHTLARAVAAAHAAGVVHRDLKPSNVLLAGDPPPGTYGTAGTHASQPSHKSPGYQPKIADFGLAKLAGTDSGHTQTGAVIGTPSYMAPEQASGRSRDVGPSADLYAVGAILYECLSGRPPFQGATVTETLEQVRTQDPVPPRRLQPRVPRDLETICLKCLEKDPARRYASAADLVDDLDRYLDHRPIRARPVGPVGRAVKWARRRPAVAALVGVIAAATLTLVAGGVVYGARLREANKAEREQRERAELALGAAEQAVIDMVRLTREELGRGDQTNLSPEAEQRAAAAIATLDRLVALSPDRPELWEELGRLCYWRCRRGDRQDLSDRAVTAFERAAALREAQAQDRAALARVLHELGDLRNARGEFDRAAEPLGRSLELFDTLVQEAPTDRKRRYDRASVRLTRGRGAAAAGQSSEALTWTLRGIEDLEAELAAPDPRGDARTRLTDAYSVVASSHTALGDHRAAVRYWDLALADRVTVGGRLRQTFQFGRAWSLAELGEYEPSEAEAANVRIGPGGLDADWLLDLAALHARNARSARAAGGPADALAAKAVGALRSARDRKVLTTAADLDRMMKENPALRELQGRPDFDALARDLPR